MEQSQGAQGGGVRPLAHRAAATGSYRGSARGGDRGRAQGAAALARPREHGTAAVGSAGCGACGRRHAGRGGAWGCC